MREELYWLGFSAFHGIGPARFEKLIGKFGTAKNAWEADLESIKGIIEEKIAIDFDDFRKKFSLQEYEESLTQKNIQFVTTKDKDYPALLKKISHPPFLLYFKGDVKIFNSPKIIAIVGTRKITDYGTSITEMITSDLVQNGFVTVSGLAFGVDGVVHRSTIESNGKTIAVLGGGVDVPTPIEHERLALEIVEKGGLVVSSVVPSERPLKGYFPARNRIIAGLSLGVVVTEGAADSGALITAGDALKIGRPVFAVPGPITSDLSKGPHILIQKGANFVTNAKEILDKLGIMETQKASTVKHKALIGDSKKEDKVLNLLQNGQLHFDEIARRINMDSSEIGSLLSLMELKGIIRISRDGKYSL